MRLSRPLASAAVLSVAITTALIAAPASAAPGDVDVQLLALSDFHGRISPQSGGDAALPGFTGDVGGAAYMATLLDQQEADFRNDVDNEPAGDGSYFVGAGDLINASPFESSVFRDEPTIEALNAMDLDYSSVGNHEFDRGFAELQRIEAGGCSPEPDDDCFPTSTGGEFAGTGWPYLAANVINDATGLPALDASAIVDVPNPAGGDPVRLGLIGAVTVDTPQLVTPTGIEGLSFTDPAEAINAEAARLQADEGVEALAVLIHEGGVQTGGSDYTDCNLAPESPILGINADTTAAVDLIISAHTHVPYDCSLPDPDGNPRPVTQAGFYGKAVTDIRMEISPITGEVDRGTIITDNIPVARTVGADPEVQAIVDYWATQSAEPSAAVLGTQTADLDRANLAGAPVRNAESGFGNLIADAQLAALQADPATFGDPVAAFMNPGGIRADINCADVPSGEPVGTITFGEAFTAQPFSNTVNVVTITGADIDQVLEEQWRIVPPPSTAPPGTPPTEALLLLSTSDSLRYDYDPRLPLGQRVDIASITIDGTPIDAAAEYDIVANSFLTAGGDAFAGFTNGTEDPITGPNDVDALADYLGANSPVAPPALDRANSLDPAQPQDDDGSGTGPCDLPVTPPGGGAGLAVTVSPTTVAIGETLTITGTGFAAGEAVAGVLASTPVDLGTKPADANGTVVFSVRIPASLEVGPHIATLSGASGSATAPFNVVAAGSTLAQTGLDSLGLSSIAGLLLLSGAGACLAGRRRGRTAEPAL